MRLRSGTFPNPRQLAVARAKLADAKKRLAEIEPALTARHNMLAAEVGRRNRPVDADPETVRVQREHAKALAAVNDAARKVDAARIAATRPVLEHLAHFAPTLQRHVAECSEMLSAIARLMQDVIAIAITEGTRGHAAFRNSAGIAAASAYVNARFSS